MSQNLAITGCEARSLRINFIALIFLNKFCILKSAQKPQELFVCKYPQLILSLASLTLHIAFFDHSLWSQPQCKRGHRMWARSHIHA